MFRLARNFPLNVGLQKYDYDLFVFLKPRDASETRFRDLYSYYIAITLIEFCRLLSQVELT